jgi:hypothetical protein
MKANELRIGNFVSLPFENDKIHTIRGVDIQCLQEGMDSQSVKPIIITGEWLLKFGFYLDKNQWYNIKYFTDCNESTEEMCITINLASNRCAIFDAIEETDMVNILSYPIFTAKRIDYVHQLQNLYFALTGKELTYGGNK